MNARAAPPRLRSGGPGDATCIALLSTQVFLDTYATEGVRPDLAREALRQHSPDQFERRLADTNRSFIVAEVGDGLLGFAELDARPSQPPVPASSPEGFELVRLYVQPAAQRTGLGRRLLLESEVLCKRAGIGILWLQAWSQNARALAFYRALGFEDVGTSTYSFEDRSYENRVLVKQLGEKTE